MTSSRTRQSFNKQSQLHKPAHHMAEVEAAEPKHAAKRDTVFIWDTNGSTTLQPSALPDPIFGYPSED